MQYLQQETRALSTEEVKALIQQFISGAVRVKKAGCDGVELHAAHGYLLQQFLSPYTNKREDEYGGSFENRLRMITEIINGIRVQCGPDFPIGVRLSVEEFLDKTGVSISRMELRLQWRLRNAGLILLMCLLVYTKQEVYV